MNGKHVFCGYNIAMYLACSHCLCAYGVVCGGQAADESVIQGGRNG